MKRLRILSWTISLGDHMIEINNNSIVVRNVKEDSVQWKKMQSRFAFFDKVIHKYTFSFYTKVEDDYYFPVTVGEETIKSIFPEKQVQRDTATLPKPGKIDFNMKHFPRDDLQKKALKFLLSIKKPEEMKQRLISLPTGSGKTFVTISAIQELKMKALIIVDKISLAEQWKNQFLLHTDLQEDEICLLSGNESVEEAKTNKKYKVYIAIHRTLQNLLSDDYNAINTLMTKLKIGIRVFDEAHVEFKSICRVNSFSNILYTIYLTATPNRSQFLENKLYEKVFKNIPYFDGRTLAPDKYHNVLMVQINTKPSIQAQASVKTRYGFSSAKWASYITDEGYEEFYTELTELIKKLKLRERNLKVAIIFPTIELIKKVQKGMLRDFKDISLGTFIGELKKEEDRLEALSKTFILTNDKMFDKAIDVPGLEVLINCVPFASQVKAEQVIGRLRYQSGKTCLMIDIGDFGFTECQRQYKLRKRFYKKHAKTISEIKNY